MDIKDLSLTEKEQQLILADADDMLNGQYRFNGVWDMEPCSVPVKNDPIQWDMTYQGDKEWIYMFTRMDYLYKLLIAAQLSGEKKYIDHGLKIIDAWFDRNFYSYHQGDNWLQIRAKARAAQIKKMIIGEKRNLSNRTLDVSIMIANVIDYLLFCENRGYIGTQVLKAYQKKLHIVSEKLFRLSETANKSLLNWGIIENANILYCMCRADCDFDKKKVYERLVRQVYNQLNANGSQIESSPMYLVQILLVLLKVIRCENNPYKEELIKPVRQGCAYIASIRRPDFRIPNLGDSDLTDISDLMIIAGHVLDDDNLLCCADRALDPEYRFKYQLPASYTPKKPEQDRSPKTIAYPDQTIYRGAAGSYLLCSNIAKRVDGHKHYDYLSILFCMDGKDILADAGRYSYKNDADRKYFIGEKAHNTVSIKSLSYFETVPDSSWQTKQMIECRENKVIADGDHFSVGMLCVLGFSEITVRRYVTLVPDKGLLITDMVDSDKPEQYTAFFNIGKTFSVRNDAGMTVLCDPEMCLYYHNDRQILPVTEEAAFSEKYNEKFTSSRLVINTSESAITHCILKSRDPVSVSYNSGLIQYRVDNEIIEIPT